MRFNRNQVEEMKKATKTKAHRGFWLWMSFVALCSFFVGLVSQKGILFVASLLQ